MDKNPVKTLIFDKKSQNAIKKPRRSRVFQNIEGKN